MARRKRVKRRQRKRGGRRLLVRAGIGVVLLVPVVYFVFTQMFYDPFEESQPPFPILVPRNVDLFIRREALASDVEVFPRPALLDRFKRTRAYRELSETRWWQGLDWPEELEGALQEAEAATADLPLDPLGDLIGSEVALVGRLPPDGEPELALMARISGSAKLSIEALDFGMLRSRALPNSNFSEEQDPDFPGLVWRRLDVLDAGTFYYARELDLLVASRSSTLVRDILRTVRGSREASLGLSRLYIDSLPAATGEPDERFSVDLLVDAQSLLTAAGLEFASDDAATEASGVLPVARPGDDAGLPTPGEGGGSTSGTPDAEALAAVPGPDAMVNALERLVDLSLLREVVARVELDESIAVRLFADVDHAMATERHTGLVGAPGFMVQERLRDALAMLPADTSGVVVLNVELRPFLQTLTAAFNPDMVRLLDETLRDIVRYNPGWPVDNLSKLIDYLDRTLDGRLTLAVRPLDHNVPEGSQPLPLVALIAPISDAQRWRQLDETIVRAHKVLGLDRERMWQQDEGVGLRKWLGLPSGLPVEEISYIVLDGATAVIGTDDAFVHEIVAAYANNRSALHSTPEVREMVERFGKARGNVAGWGNAEALLGLIEPYGEYVADQDTLLDYGVLRLAQRKRLLQGEFRSFAGKEDEMPPEAQEQLEAQLDDYIAGLEADRQANEIPALAQAFRERKQWLTLLDSFAFSLRIGDRDAEMALYADTVLDRR
jgi:hypothetical protein